MSSPSEPRLLDECHVSDSSAAEHLVVWTIGHSTRAVEEFIALLAAQGIRRLADVRSVPRSSRHPHFSADQLSQSVSGAGITYRHLPGLGGLRRPRRDSTNLAWQNGSFRGYADYMETAAFEEALDELVALAVEPTAIMCAEAVWWRCHRQLIADALVARGIGVRHIVSTSRPQPHHLTSFAVVTEGRVRYPGLL
jgi:uncharacterized protein (DUF488 family)